MAESKHTYGKVRLWFCGAVALCVVTRSVCHSVYIIANRFCMCTNMCLCVCGVSELKMEGGRVVNVGLAQLTAHWHERFIVL